MIPVNRPLLTSEDIESVVSALQNTWVSGETPPVISMEKKLSKYLSVKDSVAVSSGTSALDVAIEALDIQPGQECIVPTFTIVSTVSNLLRKNARLKLIDSDPNTWSINSSIAAETISKETKLVLPVHIYGLSVDMDPIVDSANNSSAFILEDAAEALGVEYRGAKVGSLGHASIFSFYANKIVTGGEGGAIASNDLAFLDRVKYLRNLCFNPENRFVHEDLGWNLRISGISAALISSQLERIDQIVNQKILIAEMYLEGLAGHPWFSFAPRSVEYSKNTYWVFPILLNDNSPYDAKSLQSALEKNGVQSRRFFCPIHMQPFAKKYDITLIGKMNISERLWMRGIYLPSGLGISKSEIEKVIEVCWDLVDKNH